MIKLIASDMDGTLLDSQKRLPPDLPAVLCALGARGVTFAVASGRQYGALRRDLPDLDMPFICENGALIMHRDEPVFLDPMPANALPDVLRAAHGLSGVYPVLCRARVALVEASASPAFIAETARYYPDLQVVDDLTAHAHAQDVCKVAFYDEGDAQTHELPVLERALGGELSVVLSGEHWVDVMKPGVNKGCALRALQQRMGIGPQNCMAFGDYLNDIELLQAAQESYAMKNAHPALFRVARHIAPGNDEDGVLRVIRAQFAL